MNKYFKMDGSEYELKKGLAFARLLGWNSTKKYVPKEIIDCLILESKIRFDKSGDVRLSNDLKDFDYWSEETKNKCYEILREKFGGKKEFQ